jgi:hypothetical protein
MTSKEFTHWLKGYFELTDEKDLCEWQIDIIKAKLDSLKEVETDLVSVHDLYTAPQMMTC